jgi:hypothetical protein
MVRNSQGVWNCTSFSLFGSWQCHVNSESPSSSANVQVNGNDFDKSKQWGNIDLASVILRGAQISARLNVKKCTFYNWCPLILIIGSAISFLVVYKMVAYLKCDSIGLKEILSPFWRDLAHFWLTLSDPVNLGERGKAWRWEQRREVLRHQGIPPQEGTKELLILQTSSRAARLNQSW